MKDFPSRNFIISSILDLHDTKCYSIADFGAWLSEAYECDEKEKKILAIIISKKCNKVDWYGQEKMSLRIQTHEICDLFEEILSVLRT